MHEMLNIPKHTNCTNCGKCCGFVPVSGAELNAIRDYIAVNGIKPIVSADKSICPFRDEKAKKCLIYPARPIICRLFGVAKGIAGDAGVMQCPNGNSAEIDGVPFIPKEDVHILNFVRW